MDGGEAEAGARRGVLWTAGLVAFAVAGATSCLCAGGALLVASAFLHTGTESSPVGETGAGDAPDPLVLAPGRPTTATLDAETTLARFQVEVPEEAVGIRLHVTCDEGPVHADLAFGPAALRVLTHGEEPVWHAYSPDTLRSMEWTVSRAGTPEFAPGFALVEVHAEDEAPEDEETWTVRVGATFVLPPRPDPLAWGGSAEGSVAADGAWFRVFELPPREDPSLPVRIDLASAEEDLDLLVGFGAPAFDEDAADAAAAGSSPVETLLLGEGGAARPPEGAPVFVTVLAPAGPAMPARFRLFATEGRDAPPPLREVPALPVPADDRERAMITVVEVVAGEGRGSGVIVSEDGFVLTAHHVVSGARAPGKGPADAPGDVVLSASPDVRVPPRTLFRARVVAWDEGADVALLRVVSGAFGQPLPDGYRFPAAVRAESRPHLGETLTTVGYPGLDGDLPRNPVTVSRGVLSGYTAGRAPQLARTDAFVAGGSSGGSVLDAKGRLVGVVLEGHAETDGGQRLSAYLPVDSLPAAVRGPLGW